MSQKTKLLNEIDSTMRTLSSMSLDLSHEAKAVGSANVLLAMFYDLLNRMDSDTDSDVKTDHDIQFDKSSGF